MELPPGGRSIPAGDPRANDNPYRPEPWVAIAERRERASRATPLDKMYKIHHRDPRFHRPKPFYGTGDDPEIPLSSAGAWGRAAVSEAGKPRDQAETATGLVWDHIRQAKRKEDERIHEQANESFRKTKRARDMQIINQAVAQQVPARPPFQRSFIPHDLWHMLSPNDS